MPEINNPTPNERDVPVFQPGQPTPEDPRKDSPVRDPPVDPEHDVDETPPTKQADSKILYEDERHPG